MKENQRVKVTKKMLKDSLLQILSEKDLDDITVTELCALAQINRSTFYRYYKLPVDVLAEIEQDFVTDLITAMNSIKSVADVKAYLKALCENCRDKSGIWGHFLRSDIDTEHALALSDLYKKTSVKISGIDQENEDIKIVGTYFAGGAYFVLRSWVAGNIERTPEEMASLLWQLMTYDYSSIAKDLK